MVIATARFAGSLPVHSDFAAVLDFSSYTPVPEDWWIAVSDVVESRRAIAAGRYKAVNMAGVALISALMNALKTQDIPFVFGGDGSASICAPEDLESYRTAMAKTATWAGEELGLELRVALIPVTIVRKAGYDVLVKATRISDIIHNYAFRGGGISHAEELMKKGEFGVHPAPAGGRPDLRGLSCRWTSIRPDRAQIVSIIVEPAPAAADRFPDIARKILRLAGMEKGVSGSPMPESGPSTTWPPEGLDLEARAARGSTPLFLYRLRLFVTTLIGRLFFVTNLTLGSFDPRHYRRQTSLNTDYRKYQDGLRVTVSLDQRQLDRLTELLEKQRTQKRVRYGLCVQDSAVLTCYVPSVTSNDHFHFLDGAGGGYANAATNMRA